MRSVKSIRLFLAVFICFALFSGCSQKTEINSAVFKASAKDDGYTVYDVTDKYDAAVVKKCYIAKKADKDYQIEFLLFTSLANAGASYEENKKPFVPISGTPDKEYTKGDIQYFEDTNSLEYVRIVRVGVSMLFIHCNYRYKDEAKVFAENLGY